MQPAKHVLVVEDDAATRCALTLVLEGAGYRVGSAQHGEAALDYLRAQGIPDLVLLDLMMPVMDGWEFRQRQQGVPAWRSIPVIIFSAAGNVPQQAAALGAVDFLQKPVEFEKLLETIRRHCPQTRGGSPATRPISGDR